MLKNHIIGNLTLIYFLKRLLPFYLANVALEAIETGLLCFVERDHLDWSIMAIARMLSVLFLQLNISFLYIAFPLIIYLIALPKEKVYTKFDKRVTFTAFILFIFAIIFEEVSECIFWNEFGATFNFIAVDYLIYTKEVIGNIWESYPIIWILLGIVTASFSVAKFFEKSLFPQVVFPAFKNKTTLLILWGSLCVGAFVFVDIKMAEQSPNRYNNEISKDGLYSLFSAFIKNELSYNDFYMTRSNEENTQLLRQEFKSDQAVFADMPESIKRTITPKTSEKKLNVIVVIMESMGFEFFDENHQLAITPNLSDLSKQGIFFSRVYATGTRTVRGLEGISLSIPPLPGMSIVRREGNDNLYSIGSVFKDYGYTTTWIYGGFGYFDNMNAFYEKNGFKIIDRTNLSKSEITHANVWGVADEDIYRRAITEADEDFKQKKPFLQVIMTTSNHRPFTYPDGKIDIPSKTSRFGAVKYADYAIGELVKQAKTKPWFDNTLFIFVADHGAGSAGKQELNPETHRIPLIFYAPKHFAPNRQDYPISQIDVLPTLLGLLNFTYDSVFYGKDAFDKDYTSRWFVSNYQFIGYAQDNDLVVLKPVKDVSYYKQDQLLSQIPPINLLNKAIGYYQHASNWREHIKK